MWEFDPARGTVMLVLHGRGFDVPVCVDSTGHQIAGAFPITRITEEIWRIAPASFRREGDAWLTRSRPYPDSGENDNEGVCDFIFLTHAPESVRAELEALGS